MSRIRTARQAYEEIKRNDPESCISERQIRDILRSGNIPIIRRFVKGIIPPWNLPGVHI